MASRLLLVLALPLVAGPAPALTPPPDETGPALTPPGRREAALAEQNLADLRARLRISPAQEPAWNDFAATMRGNAARMDRWFQENPLPAHPSAVDDMREYTRLKQARVEDLQRLTPKFEALYAMLSPAQRREADRIFERYARPPALRPQRH